MAFSKALLCSVAAAVVNAQKDVTEGRCRGGVTGIMYIMAPRCFYPCAPEICTAVESAMVAYGDDKNLEAAADAVCRAPEAFKCLLHPDRRTTCRRVFSTARLLWPTFPLPKSMKDFDRDCADRSTVKTGSLRALPQPLPQPQSSVSLLGHSVGSRTTCTGGLVGKIAALVPQCINPCKPTVCGALHDVIDTYSQTAEIGAAMKKVCEHKRSFKCMLDRKHRAYCQTLWAHARRMRLRLPTSQRALRSQCAVY